MNKWFYYEGTSYNKGTVVKVKQEYEDKFGFHSNVVFEEFDDSNQMYCFRSLHNCWDRFYIPQEQLQEYIEEILEPYQNTIQLDALDKVNPHYIEGIVSAWMWYILIMLFGCFLKGPVCVIITWVITSIIFFSWRYKKKNGE